MTESLLLLVAGAKGAVASTLSTAAAAMQNNTKDILPNLITGNAFPYLGPPQAICVAGWDKSNESLLSSIKRHGVLPEHAWKSNRDAIEQTTVLGAPPTNLDFEEQVATIVEDIHRFKGQYPKSRAVFVNLLPACDQIELSHCRHVSQLYTEVEPAKFPDLPYCLAAIRSGVPVVNFTPNKIEIPTIIDEAIERGVPISGRDGKTGQTYLKVVLASALKARALFVDGWYSLNILGNADGENLMNPAKAAGKMINKTQLLDEILGYAVGEQYGVSSHKVHIDYYPPRGDAKEAWDVIDFQGIFGLPMSIRLNLLGRDSILAAPLVLDLARWMAALQMAGYCGPVADLGFYYKKPVGSDPPLTFQDQVDRLQELELDCERKVNSKNAVK
jgi:myo-inositol-1-phosphate synthase